MLIFHKKIMPVEEKKSDDTSDIEHADVTTIESGTGQNDISRDSEPFKTEPKTNSD